MIAAVVVVAALVAAALGGWRGRRSADAALARAAAALHHKEEELRRARHQGAVTLKLERDRAAERAPSPIEAELRALRAVVAPLAAHAHLEHALEALGRGDQRRDLRALLEELVRRASLSGAVLSDAAGLTVAAVGVDGADVLAASASMLFALADRLAAAGQPAPLGFAVRDAEGRCSVYRLFSVGVERYVLTAHAKGSAVAPDMLDPVLPELRRLLEAQLTALVA